MTISRSRPTCQLGVDLGTTNTVAVLRWPDGRIRPLLFDGSPILSSAVFCRSNGLIVGRDAVHSARTEPEAYEPTPKRRVDEGTVLLGRREVPVVELLAAVLRRVRTEAERAAGTAPEQTALTYPAAWGPRRRGVLVEAAEQAGMAEPRLVAEPVAAAAHFVLGRHGAVPPGRCVLIYDFGGGTFDATVVLRTPDGYRVLATEGLPDAGGLDIDSAIVGYLGASYSAANPDAWSRLAQPRTGEDRRARVQLWDDVRAAKEMLSRTTSTGVHLPLLGLDAVIGREQLELLAGPILERTVGASLAVLRDAGVAPGTLGGVFLVGGSSRMPLVATMLHRALGLAPVGLDQPELAVAEGSLLTGDLAALPDAAGPPVPLPEPPVPVGPVPYPVGPPAWPQVSRQPLLVRPGPVPAEPVGFAPQALPPGAEPPTVPTGVPGGTAPPGRRSRGAVPAVVATVLVLVAAAGTAAAMGFSTPDRPATNQLAGQQSGPATVVSTPSVLPSTMPVVPPSLPTRSPSHSASPRRSTPASSRPPSVGPTFAGHVHRSGPLQVPQTYLADLDEVAVTETGADIWFHAVTATARYVEVQGGDTQTYLHQPGSPGAACAAASLSAAPVPVDVFGPGDVLCVRTDQGRLSVVRFNAAVGPSPGTLDVTVTTYDP